MAKRWYVVHVFSGSEKRVAQSINEQVADYGAEDDIEQVLVPTDNVVEMRRGARVKAERKFFPGYIMVKMDLTDQAWHIVQSQNRVTGFLGSDGKPTPISDAEAERLLQLVDEGVARTHSDIVFEIGEWVRVAEGPFASLKGMVEEVDEDKSRLKVAVSIFGRSTPVDLDFSQVEKST